MPLLKPLVLNRYSYKFVLPSAVADPEDSYEVKEILDVKRSKGKLFHLIDWKGFGPEERSWEPMENLHAPELLRKFYCLQILKRRSSKREGTVTVRGAAPLHGRHRTYVSS